MNANSKTRPESNFRSSKQRSGTKEKIAILFAVNNGYAPYLGVTLASLMMYAGKHQYELVVLYQHLNEHNRELLEHIVSHLGQKTEGGFHLQFMEMPINMSDYDFALGYKPFPLETWFRLFAPSLLPKYDKILWLDADIVVRDDVAKLYATDVGDNWIAACRWDYGVIGLLERERRQKASNLTNYFTKVLGIKKPKEDYVNAGVMVLNLQAMREHGVQEKLLQAAQNPAMHFHDQCAINMVCQGHIHYVDSEWNGLVSYNLNELPLKYRKKAIADKKSRKIIHWAGSFKPWREPWCEAAVDWWAVARLIPYYEEILYTNICTILRRETKREILEQGNRLTESGKAPTEPGGNLTR